jgi:hypothetical protein
MRNSVSHGEHMAVKHDSTTHATRLEQHSFLQDDVDGKLWPQATKQL